MTQSTEGPLETLYFAVFFVFFCDTEYLTCFASTSSPSAMLGEESPGLPADPSLQPFSSFPSLPVCLQVYGFWQPRRERCFPVDQKVGVASHMRHFQSKISFNGLTYLFASPWDAPLIRQLICNVIGTSDKGPSKKGTTSQQRTHFCS